MRAPPAFLANRVEAICCVTKWTDLKKKMPNLPAHTRNLTQTPVIKPIARAPLFTTTVWVISEENTIGP